MAIVCREVEDSLTDYLGGNLSRVERDAVTAHLLSCPACLSATAELAQLRVSLRAATSPGPGVRERLWRAVSATAQPAYEAGSLSESEKVMVSDQSTVRAADSDVATGAVPGLDLIARAMDWIAALSRLRTHQLAVALPMGLRISLPRLDGD